MSKYNLSNFWFIIYETEKCHNLESYDTEKDYPKLTQYDKNILKKVIKKLKSIDFDKLNELSEDWEKHDKFKKLYKKYSEIDGYTFTGFTGNHFIIIESYGYPIFDKTSSLYGVLKRSHLSRGKKIYPITNDLLYDMIKLFPQWYHETLFINSNLEMFQKIKIIVDFFQNYINIKYPIMHKYSILKKDILCSESQNGILRAVVHQVGFSYVDNDDIVPILESGYLEIQNKPYEQHNGIFTTLVGVGKKLTESYFEKRNFYLVFSLSVLDDFDYWTGIDMKYGRRDQGDFYKNICSEDIKKYSSAERGYLFLNQKDKKLSHETVFTSDINLKRYLQAIYVPNRKIYNKLMSSDNLKLWMKNLLINKDDTSVVYRKNCTGDIPKKITQKEKNRASKLIKNIGTNYSLELPKINYNSINMKRMVSLTLGKIGESYSENFPILYDMSKDLSGR